MGASSVLKMGLKPSARAMAPARHRAKDSASSTYTGKGGGGGGVKPRVSRGARRGSWG